MAKQAWIPNKLCSIGEDKTTKMDENVYEA